MSELETLQAVVADETRSAEERKIAAEHILALQDQPTVPAPTASVKRRFTETEDANLAHMKAILEELSRPEPAQPKPDPVPAPASQPAAPVPDERKPMFTREDLFRYRQWCVDREFQGLSTSVQEWLADTGR